MAALISTHLPGGEPRSAGILTTIFFLVAVGACDLSSPSSRLDLEITADPATEVVHRQTESPQILCDVTLNAIARGTPGAYARWRNGTFQLYAGVHGDSLFHSRPVSEAEIHEKWGARITVGEENTAIWNLWAGVPFTVEGEFRYSAESNGENESVPVSFTCGPGSAAETESPAPVLTDFALRPRTGDIEPGDTLTVDYAARSELGVWVTNIIISGAFTDTLTFAEGLENVVGRSVKIAVPPMSSLGQEARVHLAVFDAALQSDTSDAIASATLVDTTPPEAIVGVESPWRSCPPPRCQFGVGDSISIFISGGDNHSLAWLIYEVGDPVITRDSVSLPSDRYHGPVPVLARSSWEGDPPIRSWVRDAAGNVKDGDRAESETVHIFPIVDRPVRTREFDHELTDARLDAARGVIYLPDTEHSEVAVISLGQLEQEPSIDLPGIPASIDLSISGDSLLAALPNSHAVAVADLTLPATEASLVPITAVDAAEGFRATSLRVLGNGKWFVAANEGEALTRTGRVVEIDRASGKQAVRIGPEEAGSGDPFTIRPLTRSDDRSRMLVRADNDCTLVYDSRTDGFGPCKAFGRYDADIAVPDRTGTLWASQRTVYDAAFDSIGFVPRGRDGRVAAPSPDGAHVFVSEGEGFEKVRVRDSLVVERIPAPYLWHGRVFFASEDNILVAVGGGYYAWRPTVVVVIELD